uniref:CnrY/NccY family anti-sigma factor n=1 Tax=uncultured Caulobacter sp. TaxID=158749 RepID=UPI0025F57DD8|nr:CnrY/NccY family anti-sigma factor [uncultured Caulobacter sp.]
MSDFDKWLNGAAKAHVGLSAGAADALAARLAGEPAPGTIESRREWRQLTACLMVATLFGAATTSGLGMIQRTPTTQMAARWPAAAFPVSPSNLLAPRNAG